MRERFNNKYVKWGFTAFLVIAAGICFYYLVFHINNLKANINVLVNILMPILFAIGTAYLLTPVLNCIEYKLLIPLCEKCKIRESEKRNGIVRAISTLLTGCLFFLLIYAIIAMLLSQIVPSVQSLINNFDTYVDNITIGLNKLLEDHTDVKDFILKNVDKYSEELESWANTSIDSVLLKSREVLKTVSMSIIGLMKGLWNFILGFLISIYLLAGKEKLAGQSKKILYALFKKDSANVILNNFRFVHKTFIGFIGGKIVDSIIIGILCFIGTSILKTPYAILVSVVVGVTNVIPFFGPFLGAIPSTILIFVVDPMHPLNCVYFVLFIIVLQQFDGNILGPKILGNSTGLTGFCVIFAITLFGGLFGILGMIVGVPIFAVIFAAVKSLIQMALRKKEMPMETQPYMNVGAIDEEGFHEYIPNAHKDIRRIRKEKKEKRDTERICFGDKIYSSAEDIKEERAGSADTAESAGKDGVNAEERTEDSVQAGEGGKCTGTSEKCAGTPEAGAEKKQQMP